MLVIPDNSEDSINLIGIDPGTTMVGLSVINLDIETLKINYSKAWSVNANKLIDNDAWVEYLFSARTNRVLAIRKMLERVFKYFKPTIITSESPFINSRFPQSGIALTEVLSAITAAVMAYDRWTTLHLISPSEVKNAVKAKGNADKTEMKRCITLISDLNYAGEIPMVELDEHAIDALAVNYSKVIELRRMK